MTNSERIKRAIAQLNSVNVPVLLTAEIAVPLYNAIAELQQIRMDMENEEKEKIKMEAESTDEVQVEEEPA